MDDGGPGGKPSCADDDVSGVGRVSLAVRTALKIGRELALTAGIKGDRAEGGAFLLVVFVETHGKGGGGVGGLPAPFADGNKLERYAEVGAQTGAVAADEELVADADVRGDEQARGIADPLAALVIIIAVTSRRVAPSDEREFSPAGPGSPPSLALGGGGGGAAGADFFRAKEKGGGVASLVMEPVGESGVSSPMLSARMGLELSAAMVWAKGSSVATVAKGAGSLAAVSDPGALARLARLPEGVWPGAPVSGLAVMDMGNGTMV